MPCAIGSTSQVSVSPGSRLDRIVHVIRPARYDEVTSFASCSQRASPFLMTPSMRAP